MKLLKYTCIHMWPACLYYCSYTFALLVHVCPVSNGQSRVLVHSEVLAQPTQRFHSHCQQVSHAVRVFEACTVCMKLASLSPPRAVEHPRYPVVRNYVRVGQYFSEMVIKAHSHIDQVKDD